MMTKMIQRIDTEVASSVRVLEETEMRFRRLRAWRDLPPRPGAIPHQEIADAAPAVGGSQLAPKRLRPLKRLRPKSNGG
jgi:hypothetical protein